MDKHAAVTSLAWKHGKVESKNFPFEELSDRIDEDCVVWVDLPSTDHDALAALADELSIDPVSIEDALAENERPKLYHYDKFKFVTAYAVKVQKDGTLSQSRISAYVTEQAMVTVRTDDGFDMAALLRRWKDNSELIERGVGGLVHGLLDLIVDGHFEAVQQLDDAIESLEDDLFADNPQTKEMQRRSFQLRKSLVALRRVVLPMREVVGALQREDNDTDPVLRPYFDDLYDHVLRAMEWTESVRDMVSTVFETNLSLADARLNTVMKKLTSWAAIIAVPTLVTGFYGQNVPYPGFQHAVGFWTSTLVMIVSVVALYVVFRWKDWL